MPTLTRLARPPTLRPARRLVPAAGARGLHGVLPWLLGSLGATMATLVGQVPAWTLLTFALCTAWRLLTDRWQRALPSLAVRLAVFLPMALGIVFTYNAHVDAGSMLAFLVALVSLKILELRSARDVTVVSLLGFFMSLSAFFFNQSLGLAVFLGAALVANVVALVRCHGAGPGQPAWPSARLALGLIVQALPLVVLMFLVFPRVQATFLLRISNPSAGLTGMSDHLQPGTFGSLVQSDEIAFRAKVNDGATLVQNQLYWRGLVLDVGDSAMSWRGVEPNPLPTSQTLPGAAGNRVEQVITLMPHGERWLFALDRPVDVKGSSSFRAQACTSQVLRSQSPVYNKTIYTAVSDLAGDPAVPLNPDRRRFYTKVPAGVGEKSLALARGLRHPGADRDEDAVRAALAYLGKDGFSYSLTPGPLPPENALDYFLFQSKKGFCEHYAAAFTSLMRAAGVPSRLVVGYQGGEFNTWGKYYTVRQSDAHAWAEVWLEGRGWQRVDPTGVIAPDRVSYGAEGYAALSSDGALDAGSRLDRLRRLNAPGPLRWLGRNALLAWDNLDQQWNQLVLGYDTEQQLNVFQRLNLGDLDLLGGTVLTLASVFSLLAVGMAGARFFTRGRAVRADPARELYALFCRRVTRAAKVVRGNAEGPLDFARRAAGALPAHADEIRRITDLYVASRYAADAGGEGGLSTLAREVRRFRPGATASA